MPAALLAASLILAVPGAAPLQRGMRDWIAVCDNLRSCTLKAVPPFDTEQRGGLGVSVRRDAGGRSGLIVSVWRQEGGVDPRALRVDGRPVAAPWRADQDTQGVVLGGDAALAFLRRIREGREMTLGAGADSPRASLTGLAAALLVADEAQGRIGTVTAAARPGPRPASDVPPPPPLPVVTAAPLPPPLTNGKALIAAVRRARAADLEREDCQPDLFDEDAAQPLTATEAVVTIGCLRGAYQGSVLAYRVPRRAPARARPLDLPLAPGARRGEGDDGRLHTFGGYDPATATFGETAKGRGLADCGESSEWVFDGRRFVPSSHAAQERCGGQDADWPVVYRTRTAERR